MRGSSRAAAIAGSKALDAVLAGGADPRVLGDQLLAVVGVIDGSATLRRALGDPSREGSEKQALAERLLDGKVSAETIVVVKTLVGQRWATERDLSDTLEELAVTSILAGAEKAGRIDRVEDELFRFERIVAGNPELRDRLTNRQGDVQAKAGVVNALLGGKAAEETVRLANLAVVAPRGRKFDRTLELYLALAARRREQLTAVVTAATDLTEQQRERLAAALQNIYGKPILLQVVIEEQVLGGVRVQVGDEVVDGTVLRRLDEARRHIAG
ncbi:F-type H+-transporting ATPase subunit delta [Phycicoccus badiiscoriae]|uniref:ATP synthase subunit delta n=1 Tax=Pedococcus badiiscoriae TaxID=642776 RepID=A0A852WAF3_9MICO|nr:F0F1 ATP synthase subunit delta [Pedococcus badiiscoriae]NYG06033.1 F-type H+-transporting ATPase subunit delta [Pedococcus badiiscoriae]